MKYDYIILANDSDDQYDVTEREFQQLKKLKLIHGEHLDGCGMFSSGLYAYIVDGINYTDIEKALNYEILY
jgi:hypothetical protein